MSRHVFILLEKWFGRSEKRHRFFSPVSLPGIWILSPSPISVNREARPGHMAI